MRSYAIRASVAAAPHHGSHQATAHEQPTSTAAAVPPLAAPQGSALLPVPLPPMGGGRGEQSGEATLCYTRLVLEPDTRTHEGRPSEELGACVFSTFAEPTDDAAASRLIFAPFVRLLNPTFATPLCYSVERLGTG